MKKFAVFVATTGGPVQIERLTPDNGVKSVVCRSGSTKTLPMTDDYHDFVRQGTGVVEERFGPLELPSFRADVDGHIGTGNSWQLPFLIAHAIEAAPNAKLVKDIEDADHLVWATGKIEHFDLKVLQVNNLEDKLVAILEWFKGAKCSEKIYTVFIPAGQRFSSGISDKIEVIEAATGEQVLDTLDLMYLGRTDNRAEETQGAELGSKFGIGKWLAIPVITILVGIILSIYIDFWDLNFEDKITTKSNGLDRSAETFKTDTTGPGGLLYEKNGVAPKINNYDSIGRSSEEFIIELYVERAPDGRNCREVIFGDLGPAKHKIPIPRDGFVKSNGLGGVCRLIFSIDESNYDRYVAVWLSQKVGNLPRKKIPERLTGGTKVRKKENYLVEVSTSSKKLLHYQLYVISGNKPVSEKMEWAKNSLNKGKRYEDIAHVLKKEGVLISRLDHKIRP